MSSPRELLTLLLERGLVDEEKIKTASVMQSKKGSTIGKILVDLGYVEEKEFASLLSEITEIPSINLRNIKISPELTSLIPKEVVLRYNIMPIGKIGNSLTLAMVDPMDIFLIEDIERKYGFSVCPVIACNSEIRELIEKSYSENVSTAIKEVIKDVKENIIELVKEEEITDTEEIAYAIDDIPVIKITNYILRHAVEEKASDIFIEPLNKQMRVRYRIDGILREIDFFPKNMLNFVVSRIKVMANLDITEHRLPQDGRFRMIFDQREVDFRVSILPSILGEKAVLRLLDKSAGLVGLDHLGFENDVLTKIKKDSRSAYGMLLVTGPTGSGKTTTLYSILEYIFSPEKNIVTIEDPIEYRLKGINQVNVNYEVNLTFASALRSILRQDPDIIMVGEIRDFDTVDIAVKAALTGHLVLSTLHTTTACGVVTRLINMGIEPFLLSSTLIGVLAQRLVRRLCPNCKQENKIPDIIKKKLGLPLDSVIFKPRGCSQCRQQGYKGRISLTEYLQVDREIRDLINNKANETVLKKVARKKGMRTLREDGLVKVKQGLTSLEEVLRMTNPDEK